MRSVLICLALLCWAVTQGQDSIQVVFVSDLHFGLTKARFRGKDSVSSFEVNKALVSSFRQLGKIDAIIVTGDIANREEAPVQSATASWNEFVSVYEPMGIPLYLVPGNHDISNALGYYRPLSPATDKGSLAGIYSVVHPGKKLDTLSLYYREQDFNFSKNIGNIHFQFINLWPDSANRVWMEHDLKLAGDRPVFVFTHDPPEGDPKHFTNPYKKQINAVDKFENLLPQVYSAHYELEWENFLECHTNIRAYFHGHSNYQEYYAYKSSDGRISLRCFRVDSPMKGKYSSKDEASLSYQVITIFPDKRKAEVRQCFWNKGPEIQWGEQFTLSW